MDNLILSRMSTTDMMILIISNDIMQTILGTTITMAVQHDGGHCELCRLQNIHIG